MYTHSKYLYTMCYRKVLFSELLEAAVSGEPILTSSQNPRSSPSKLRKFCKKEKDLPVLAPTLPDIPALCYHILTESYNILLLGGVRGIIVSV